MNVRLDLNFSSPSLIFSLFDTDLIKIGRPSKMPRQDRTFWPKVVFQYPDRLSALSRTRGGHFRMFNFTLTGPADMGLEVLKVAGSHYEKAII